MSLRTVGSCFPVNCTGALVADFGSDVTFMGSVVAGPGIHIVRFGCLIPVIGTPIPVNIGLVRSLATTIMIAFSPIMSASHLTMMSHIAGKHGPKAVPNDPQSGRDQIVNLYRVGKSVSEIAAITNVSRGRVSQIIKEATAAHIKRAGTDGIRIELASELEMAREHMSASLFRTGEDGIPVPPDKDLAATYDRILGRLCMVLGVSQAGRSTAQMTAASGLVANPISPLTKRPTRRPRSRDEVVAHFMTRGSARSEVLGVP